MTDDDDFDDVVPPYASDGFHTLESARYSWNQAPDADGVLSDLLEIAREQCLAFGKKQLGYSAYSPDSSIDGGDAWGATDPSYLPGTGEVPTRFRVAQLMQARNLWNAQMVDPSSGGIGEDSFVMRPFPLDWTVKQILRPRSAVPAVF